MIITFLKVDFISCYIKIKLEINILSSQEGLQPASEIRGVGGGAKLTSYFWEWRTVGNFERGEGWMEGNRVFYYLCWVQAVSI